MKSFVKNSLIKLFVFMFVVCAAVTIATLPNNSKVDAATNANFKVVEDASIRNGGEDDSFTGLQFAYTFNQAWLDANQPVSGSIGLLVFPSANATEFDSAKSADENLEAVCRFLCRSLFLFCTSFFLSGCYLRCCCFLWCCCGISCTTT